MKIGSYYVHQVNHIRNIPDVPDQVFVHLRPSEGNNTAPPLTPISWDENIVPPAPGTIVDVHVVPR